MSTPLIPIAISSQLDVSGEELIHTAKYTPLIRGAYVLPSNWWLTQGYTYNDTGLATKIYRATNNFDGWSAPITKTVAGVVYDMKYLGAAVVCVGPAGQIYRSDNTGLAFSLVQTITGVASQVKWLSGSHWVISTFDMIDKIGTGDRIWYSADDGVTWTVSVSSSIIPANSEISIAYGSGTTMIGGAIIGANQQSLVKSLDYGVTWSTVALPAAFNTGYTTGQEIHPLLTYVG